MPRFKVKENLEHHLHTKALLVEAGTEALAQCMPGKASLGAIIAAFEPHTAHFPSFLRLCHHSRTLLVIRQNEL